jgi:hypothetical protein
MIQEIRLYMVAAALKLQSETGIKATRISACKAAREMGFKGTTAHALLKDILKTHPAVLEPRT